MSEVMQLPSDDVLGMVLREAEGLAVDRRHTYVGLEDVLNVLHRLGFRLIPQTLLDKPDATS